MSHFGPGQRDHLKVHAYTDDSGLTLFRVEFHDRVLQFGAHITDFELTSEREDVTSMFDNFSRYARAEQRINIEAHVIQGPVYSRPTEPEQIEVDVKQLRPGRKELPSAD